MQTKKRAGKFGVLPVGPLQWTVEVLDDLILAKNNLKLNENQM